MTSIQYMTPDGLWLESCQVGTACRYPAAVVAVEDADGFRGADGYRLVGQRWVEDPAASAEAWALLNPAEALQAERAAMEADKWQIVAVLNVMDPDLWARIEAWAAGTLVIDQIPSCDPVTRAAIAYAIRIPRMSQIVDLLAWLFGWSDDQVDQLFRAAMAMKR